jgi:amino acid adenylation domain-containing protein
MSDANPVVTQKNRPEHDELAGVDYHLLVTSCGFQRQRAYWLGRLGNEGFEVTRLVFPSPAVGLEGVVVAPELNLPLSDEASESLRALPGERERFSTALAAVVALLYRYLDQDTITLAVPAWMTGAENSTNDAVYLVVEVAGTLSFEEVVDRTSAVLAEAYSNRDYPRKELLHELPQLAGWDRSNPTNVFCHEEGLHPGAKPLEGTDLSLQFRLSDQPALIVRGRAPHWQFSATSQVAGHARNLLQCGLRAPQTSLDVLALMGADETSSLSRLGVGRRVSNLSSLHDVYGLFEKQVAREPDRVAAEDVYRRLSYGELNEEAARIAHILLANGLILGDPVPVLAERSCSLLACILGVLKAGGAFCMLDPSHPRERNQALLHNVGGALGLALGTDRLTLEDGNRRWIDLLDGLPRPAGHYRSAKIAGTDAAYIVFTSSSTGDPKGVVVSHQALVNRQRWLARHYGLTGADVSLARTPVSFDPSICEMLRLLPLGGKVVFLPNGDERNPELVAAAILRHRVTVIDLIPSPLIALMEYVHAFKKANSLESIRWVFAGAEPLFGHTVEQFKITFPPSAQLINTWGATETTVDVTSFNCSKEWRCGPVPVGRPIDNVELFLVSRSGNLAPRGMPGEIHVAGTAVASGYLTVASLQDDHFGPRPWLNGKRTYRTGDRARWLPTGDLEFLGRVDRQLKVRGIRIEPGEIERILADHHAV